MLIFITMMMPMLTLLATMLMMMMVILLMLMTIMIIVVTMLKLDCKDCDACDDDANRDLVNVHADSGEHVDRIVIGDDDADACHNHHTPE